MSRRRTLPAAVLALGALVLPVAAAPAASAQEGPRGRSSARRGRCRR